MQIHWRNPNHLSLAEQADVENRLQEIARDHKDLIDVWIDLRKSDHHQKGADGVKIRCMARGREYVAEGEGEVLSDAMSSALRAFEREVRKTRDKQADRARTRLPQPPEPAPEELL